MHLFIALDEALNDLKNLEDSLLKIATRYMSNSVMSDSSENKSYIDELRFRMSDKRSRRLFVI